MIYIGKALFVHVPKTGGSWVRYVMEKSGGVNLFTHHEIPKHHRVFIFYNRFKPFCFVRHPLSFVSSLWRHWSGEPQCRINNANEELYYQWDKNAYGQILCKNIVENDFESTLNNFSKNNPGFVSWLYEQYTSGCKFVGRYENIKKDLSRIVHQINGEVPGPLMELILHSDKVNVSKGKPQMVSIKSALEFMSKESCCSKYGYVDLPAGIVMQ